MSPLQLDEPHIFHPRERGGPGGGDSGGHHDEPGGENEPNDPDHRGESTTPPSPQSTGSQASPASSAYPTATRGRAASPERSASSLRSASPERSSERAGPTALPEPTAGATSTVRSLSPERTSFRGISGTGVPTGTSGAIRTSEPLALNDAHKLSSGSIAGIIIAGIVALALAAGALFFLKRRHRNRRSMSWEVGPSYQEKGRARTTQRKFHPPCFGCGELDHHPATLGVGGASSHDYGGTWAPESMDSRDVLASNGSASQVPRSHVTGKAENPFAG